MNIVDHRINKYRLLIDRFVVVKQCVAEVESVVKLIWVSGADTFCCGCKAEDWVIVSKAHRTVTSLRYGYASVAYVSQGEIHGHVVAFLVVFLVQTK